VFVRVSVAAELVEKESKIVFGGRAVLSMPRLFGVVDGGRVFDDRAVYVVLTAFRRAEPSQSKSKFIMETAPQGMTHCVKERGGVREKA
jgi:hypothetical protein